MKNSPFVSIMLPAYKGFALCKSIQSILDQTYTDFELIILNDCSPDNLEDMIRSFNDPRIRYYGNEENMGRTNLVGVWNKLLSLSRGEFGVIAGIISGMLHVAIVMCTSQMYSGLNLYNNGFSTGWVAIFMVPFLESFMRRFGRKNRVR